MTDNSPKADIASAEGDVGRHPFDQALAEFLENTHSIFTCIKVVLPHLLKWLQQQHNKNTRALEQFDTEIIEGGSFYKPANARQEAELLATLRSIEKLGASNVPETLQRSLFIQIFSEFDAFIGALLKAVYQRKQDLMRGITRELSFADLLAYEDLSAIKADMLEKEIDSLRRESYVDQFAKLESKFGFKTLRAFKSWPEFVEFSQRRNLIVHNAGRVNAQYLLVCDREGYKSRSGQKSGNSYLSM